VRWFNAAWRHDGADMRAAVQTMPPNDPWVDSFAAVTGAFGDPQLWPQAEVAIEESERRAREEHQVNPRNFLRLITPEPDSRRHLRRTKAPCAATIPRTT
jgi:hypothetical protein